MQPHQVAGSEAEQRLRGHVGPSAQFGLAHRPDGLAPAKHLFDLDIHPRIRWLYPELAQRLLTQFSTWLENSDGPLAISMISRLDFRDL